MVKHGDRLPIAIWQFTLAQQKRLRCRMGGPIGASATRAQLALVLADDVDRLPGCRSALGRRAARALRRSPVEGISPERFRGRAGVALTELGRSQGSTV